MKWTADLGPKGVSRDQVVLKWLKHPGNCQRYIQAKEICVLLRNAGFHDISTQSVVTKIYHVIRKYKRAHELALSGATRLKVQSVCPEYYDLVDHIDITTTINPNPLQATMESPMSPSPSHRPTGTQHPQAAESRSLDQGISQQQQQQQILDQQARKTRIIEMQVQTALIKQMRETGFSKEEIAAHLRYFSQ
ncbi:hypothetical protein LRAMOSA10469 [Lichtheimia ramosa]|uniref:Uncharacterized protein n=1 Tax=Lichtheimia ramosa TaxID=688394 RepID=A0A077WPS1_9FUNG|nr:hypothetical protein LRAMOSA10469 [Lichtheimia ramosa]